MTTTDYKKTIYFGKVAYSGKAKSNQVNVTVEIRETDKGPELSICGEIWDARHYDIESGGQNLDELLKLFPNDPKMRRIHAIWSRWHLNGLNAGSAEQMTYLRANPLSPESYKYPLSYFEVASKVLADAGLNPDSTGYKYGHAWIYEPLPNEVIEEVMTW